MSLDSVKRSWAQHEAAGRNDPHIIIQTSLLTYSTINVGSQVSGTCLCGKQVFNTVGVSDGETLEFRKQAGYIRIHDYPPSPLHIKSSKLSLENPATTVYHSWTSAMKASVMWEFLLLPARLASLGGSLESHTLVKCCCLHSQVEDMSVSYPIDQRQPPFFSEHTPNQSVHSRDKKRVTIGPCQSWRSLIDWRYFGLFLFVWRSVFLFQLLISFPSLFFLWESQSHHTRPWLV